MNQVTVLVFLVVSLERFFWMLLIFISARDHLHLTCYDFLNVENRWSPICQNMNNVLEINWVNFWL